MQTLFADPILQLNGKLPPGVTFTASPGDGRIAGTTFIGAGGVYPLKITASDGSAAQLSLTVNDQPSFASVNQATFKVRKFKSFVVKANGFPVPTIEARPFAGLPSGITLTPSGGNTITISGTAAPGSAGVYYIVFRAENSFGQTTQSFLLIVN